MFNRKGSWNMDITRGAKGRSLKRKIRNRKRNKAAKKSRRKNK